MFDQRRIIEWLFELKGTKAAISPSEIYRIDKIFVKRKAKGKSIK